MTQLFFVDDSGVFLGSYDGPKKEIPEMFSGARTVPSAPDDANQKWDAAEGAYLPLPPAPYQIAKTTPWLRMTEAEAATMDAVMSATTARLKQIYMAAQYLGSDDDLWAVMHQLLTDNLPGGEARATELLAPET